MCTGGIEYAKKTVKGGLKNVRMVWYSMVLYGVVWYGVVRYGVVWYGIV